MSWRDREYGGGDGGMGRPGGDWQGVRPTLDNPMTWSVPFGRAFGIDVRIHIVFLLYIVVELGRALAAPQVGETAPMSFTLAGFRLFALFSIVLLHEFGHCIACRWMQGEADEILMWPLGGLAYCRPPQRWNAHFVTAAGGPMVNVAIFAVLAPILGILTGTWWQVALPNPLQFYSVGTDLALQKSGLPLWFMHGLFSVHAMSFMLLLFNLLPIFPLDGGRLVQAALWPRFGYVKSMRLAVYTGYFGAIALGLTGAVTGSWILIAIAVFGGVTCYQTIRQLAWTESFMADEENDLFAASRWSERDIRDSAEADPEPEAHATRTAVVDDDDGDGAEVDRILAKISASGMDSLTAAERRLLKRATQRRREGE